MSYIVSREKPKACRDCRFLDRFFYDCILMGVKDYEDYDTQYANCPLIEVQTPHGRLIDADKLKRHIDKLPALPDGNFAGTHRNLKALINMQKAIIEAEGSEE